MVFKVGKGGVRSGNTLRGLNSARTKRYGRHACLLGYTSLGKRDLTRLVRDGYQDDPLLGETLAKTDVLLSLNKQQRWRLPAMMGQMIKQGEFHKGAVVSLLEKHKLKRKANCVSLISSNTSRTSTTISPRNNKYFSYCLDSVANDRSKRQRRRDLAERLKRLNVNSAAANKAAKRGELKNKHVIQAYTADGVSSLPPKTASSSTPAGVPVFDSDKPEYRLEVFYPCPRSCALTYNPKYTDVTVVEGKEGELEVKTNVKTPKRAVTTHRKRFTSKDIERLYCDDIDEDVDEMWDEYYNNNDDNNDDNDNNDENVDDKEHTFPAPHSDTRSSIEYTMDLLLARAEKAKDLCVVRSRTSGLNPNKTKKRSKQSSISTSLLEEEKKAHIVYVEREEADEKGGQSTAQSKPVSDNTSSTAAAARVENYRSLEFFRVILSTSETQPEVLRRAYGKSYAEASCQPRRFVLDVTDDVTNLLATSKASTKEINFSSYLVCVYDGFYDDGMAAYKVAFNSMIAADMKIMADIVPFRLTSVPDVMNALVCHLLDLKETGNLEYVHRNVTEGSLTKNDSEFLNSRMKLKVDVFDPSDEISKIAISKTTTIDKANNNNEDDQIPRFVSDISEKADAEEDEDSFCDVCYVSVTSSRIDSVSGTRLTSCDHLLCDECWAAHFRTGIKGGKTVLACGGYDCHTKVGPVTLMSVLNVSEVALLLKRQAEEEVETSENVKWCPKPGCGRAIRIDSSSSTSSKSKSQSSHATAAGLCVDVHCACGNKICFACMGPAHWPATCDQAEEYLDKLPSLTPAKEYVEEESRPIPFLLNKKKTAPIVVNIEGRLCPRCNKFIEKNGGCPQMVCRCGFVMCWRCMKSYHNGSCTPDYSYIHKYMRTVMVKHATASDQDDPHDSQDDNGSSTRSKLPKIQKNKQKATLYQRALRQREESTDAVTKYTAAYNATLVSKITKASQRYPEFATEIVNALSHNNNSSNSKHHRHHDNDDVSLSQPKFNTPVHLKRFLATIVEMKKELHTVREYTYILLQGTPHSVAKQRILKVANDLNGFCSFVTSILDLQDNQDARTAFRRLVDLQGWAERALDALIRATRSLRGE